MSGSGDGGQLSRQLAGIKGFQKVCIATGRQRIGFRIIFGTRGDGDDIDVARSAVGFEFADQGKAIRARQDKIEKDGDRRIVFLARTDDDIDGFDFKVTDEVNVLRFMLEIDGKQMPNLIEMGRNNRRAQDLPLLVRL